jgi:hypothetical protein
MQPPYPHGGEDVEKMPGGLYPPLVCVETAVGIDVRVAVTSARTPAPRVRGIHACHCCGPSAVADALPDGADTGVEVQ